MVVAVGLYLHLVNRLRKKFLFRVSALSLGTDGSTVNFQGDIDGR